MVARVDVGAPCTCVKESPLFAWVPCWPVPPLLSPGLAPACFLLLWITLHFSGNFTFKKMCQKLFFLIPEECTIGAPFTMTYVWVSEFGNCK